MRRSLLGLLGVLWNRFRSRAPRVAVAAETSRASSERRRETRQGDMAGALADYTLAASLDPKHPRPLLARLSSREAGRHKAAVADFTNACDRDRLKFTAAYVYRGKARAASGDIDGAIAALPGSSSRP